MVLSPHGNARYFLDGNRPLRYILVRYSATTLMYGLYIYIYIYFIVTSACVWCCDASTFTEHENHQTSNLNMENSREHNKRQCPDHRQTFAANRQRSQARATAPDANCFITRPKPLTRPHAHFSNKNIPNITAVLRRGPP